MTKAVAMFGVFLENEHRQKIPLTTKPTLIRDFLIQYDEFTLKQILYMSSHNKNYI